MRTFLEYSNFFCLASNKTSLINNTCFLINKEIYNQRAHALFSFSLFSTRLFSENMSILSAAYKTTICSYSFRLIINKAAQEIDQNMYMYIYSKLC